MHFRYVKYQGKIRASRKTSELTRPTVALIVETSNAYSRELLHGIHDWMRTYENWAVHLSEQGRGAQPPSWLKNWAGDGIIARIENSRIEKAVRATELPVVNVSASGLGKGIPTVISDSAAVTAMAADHLIDCGLRRFAFCGDARFPWSKQHEENFSRRVRNTGFRCDCFEIPAEDYSQPARVRASLHRFLKRLEKPVGIMCCYDILGQQVLDACRALNLRVPDEVAVIGQHNDDLLCEFCDPPLSSVIPNARKAGIEAATILDKLMKGRKRVNELTEMPPLGVATRQSTDIVAVSDPQLAAALRFIRAHAGDGINVADVLKAVPMSRTLLERKCREAIGRAPYEEILHCRMKLARQLLQTTSLPIATIAERTGFGAAERLSVVCRQLTGHSPRELRSSNTKGSSRR